MARGATAKYVVIFNRIPELIAAVEAQSRLAPKLVADKIAADAKSRAPVDTGYLRSSIHAESKSAGKEADVMVDAPYAAYVEYGTFKMAAQPFLTPAVEAHKAEFGIELVKPLQG